MVELTIAIAGPSGGRTLAFFGAEVIKLESQLNPDVIRAFGSAWARAPEFADAFTDSSPYLGEMNADKLSVGLNLKVPAALEAAKRLIAKADVFLTNYSTPAVTDLGLDEATLRADNEQLIYVGLPAFGSDPSNPYYPFISWGPNQAPLVGLDAVTGHPDQDPAGIAGFAPPDYFASLHAVMAIMTALEAREQTGRGVFVDISQFEVTVSTLGPYLLDEQLSGTVASRAGNRVPWYAPQGVYPSRGDDRWVAISVQDDAQWVALADLLARDVSGPDSSRHGGAPVRERAEAVTGTPADPSAIAAAGGGLAFEPELAHLSGRQQHHDRLDERIAAWTSGRSAEEAASRLQQLGVAAYPVQDAEAMLLDPQLRDYHWYQVRPSFRFPDGDLFSDCAMRLDDTPGRWSRGSPSLGEHTVDCLSRIGGFGQGEIDQLIEDGAAFLPAAPELMLRRPYAHVLGPLGLREVQA